MRTAQQIDEMVPIGDRTAQRFPRLRDAQLEVVRRFAEAHERNFAPGECIFDVGERAVPTWFLLSGSAEISGRDGLNQQIQLQTLESGHFTGELHHTAWLDGCVELDEKGYVLTGAQSAGHLPASERYALQTSMPRVFAIGDVRGGSTKRVASAVGEGAAVVAQIHSFLAA